MKVGIMFANSGPFSNPQRFAELARGAEQCGFESIWTVEHVVVPQPHSPYPGTADGSFPGGDDVPILDPLIPLSFAAALTNKLILGTGIVIAPQRHPLYLAKQVATLDVLSRGRVILGIGSGWMKEEFAALDIDFRTRGARTDESIQAMRTLWRADPSSFHGKHFSFSNVRSFPKPVRAQGVPIHIGGDSPAAARRAGRFGDGYMPVLDDPAGLEPLLRVMREEATKHSRNADGIELSVLPRREPAHLEQLREVVKRLRDLRVARALLAPPSSRADLRAELEQIGSQIIARL